MTTTVSISLLIFGGIYAVMFAFQKIRPFAAVFGAADAAEVAYGEDHGVHPGVRAEEQRERGRDPVDAADAAREGQWQPGGRRRAGEAV